MLTDAPAFKSAVAETGDRDISLKRIMEVHPLSPGSLWEANSCRSGCGVRVHQSEDAGYEVGQTVYFHGRKGWTEVPLKADGSAEIGGVVKGVKLVNAGSSRRR